MGRMVLVFDAPVLDRLGRFQGYTLDAERYLQEILDPACHRFMDREAAERDPRYKQLIPYVILRYEDTVFSYVRGKGASEARLRALRSIGLGGHIEPADRTLFTPGRSFYHEAAAREVREEVELSGAYHDRIVGLVNDDSTDVGAVHLGVVHVWDLAAPLARKREGQITRSAFVPLPQLEREADRLETWSQLALALLRDPRVARYASPAARRPVTGGSAP